MNPSELQKPGRTFTVSVRAEGPIRVKYLLSFVVLVRYLSLVLPCVSKI